MWGVSVSYMDWGLEGATTGMYASCKRIIAGLPMFIQAKHMYEHTTGKRNSYNIPSNIVDKLWGGIFLFLMHSSK